MWPNLTANLADRRQPSPRPIEEEGQMFDIAKARAEIEQRNRLRAEPLLPLLSMARELRKLYTVEREAEFEAFCNTSPLRKQVEAKLLARIRRQRRDPEWKPTGMLSGGGWAFSLRTMKLMRRIWQISGRGRAVSR
jgi:hypothetical protein